MPDTIPPPAKPPPKIDLVEAWWPLIARILAFFFGVYLLWDQAHVPNPPGAQEWVIAAGIGCMGPTVATAVATIIDSIRGNSKDPAG